MQRYWTTPSIASQHEIRDADNVWYLDFTAVQDEEPLFVRVRGSIRPEDALRRPNVCRLGRWLYSEVGIVIDRSVCLEDTTAG